MPQVKLKNSIFLHIPKTGGRNTSQLLLQHVKPSCYFANSYNPFNTEDNKSAKSKRSRVAINTAHEIPLGHNEFGYFCFVRHPFTWAVSLFHHRQRKGFNWQNDNFESTVSEGVMCECDMPDCICGTRCINIFLENIAKNPGIVLEYFEHYILSKPNMRVGRLECYQSDLISILGYYNEDSSLDKSCFESKIGKSKKTTEFKPYWVDEINSSEKELIQKFNNLTSTEHRWE